MTAKLKKMGYILCIGACLVFLGSIGIFHSGSGMTDVWKTLLILTLAIFLGVLSFVCKKSFELDKFDSFVLGISFATLVNAFVSIGEFELFGSWYSFAGDGVYIFLASIFILIGILSILMHIKTKVFAFIEMAFVCLIITAYLMIYHFTSSFGIALVAANVILLGANIFSLTTKKYSVFTVFTYISILFNTVLLSDKCLWSALLFNVVTFASLVVILGKYKGSYANIATEIFAFINMILLIPCVSLLDVGLEAIILIYTIIIAIYDLTVSGFKIIDLKAIKILHKVFLCIIYFIAFLQSDSLAFFMVLVPCIILIVSLLESFVLKDEHEKYFIVYKIFALALWIASYTLLALHADGFFFGAVALNALMLVIYSLVKEKHVKINSLILLSLTLLMMVCEDKLSIAEFIIGLLIVATDYALIFIKDKKENNALSKAFFIVVLFISLIFVGKVDIENYKYLIASVFYFGLYVLSGKDKLKAGFSVGFIIGSLLIYTYSMQGSPLMLKNLVLFGGLFAFAYTIIDNDKNRQLFLNISTSILIIFGLFLSLIPENIFATTYNINMPLTVALLLESVGLLLYSIIKNNKYLFYSSLVYTVFTIIELLFSIDGIPTAVVITLSGIIVISVVLVMIKKYMADEHEKDLQAEKERKEFLANSIFCGTCGNRVHKDAVYCGKCGKLIKVEKHFCGKCGSKISENDKKCPECGDKIDR